MTLQVKNYIFSADAITSHKGTRSVKDIILDCWQRSFQNVTIDDRGQLFRQKREFEENLEVEAQKLPEKAKPSFYSIAFSMATEKILNRFQVKSYFF